MSEQIKPVSIFYSYAHRDEAIRNRLGQHLSGLEQRGLIARWHDRCISPGMQWADEISARLRTARIILLLISPDFINSGYCMGNELKEAMKLHEEGKARVIPILVRSTDFDGLAFSKLQYLPRNAKPVMEMAMAKRDLVLAQIAKEIENIVTELNGTKEQSQTAKERAGDYTQQLLEKDIAVYTTHLIETLQHLKISGIIPKDRSDKNEEPDLNGIFVPLRAAVQSRVAARQSRPPEFEDQLSSEEKQQYLIVPLLEQHSCLVLLGGPGSGKSTVMRHLAWSHAVARWADGTTIGVPLLASKPIPLRIELGRLSEDRKYRFNYNFLSYTVELLERKNVKISAHMFEECLKQKRMLLLFDGLDEVATLDERKRLVEEIEHFTLCYPGNYVVVTSRPVGYELASCSKRLFVHATVQSFNSEQINEFLLRWYIYVLQLSPIPFEEQQELEILTRTLKENARLGKLAENPLLLTAIAALHRSIRLPNKRVQVYDKCTELLLERWAKHKGTDRRWKEMRMVKEDQYACVSHLGYILYKRLQQDNENNKCDNRDGIGIAIRFIQKDIESFLSSKKIITEVTEQRLEARRFLDLVCLEAGLIVEHGMDENNEPLYGFVHRTFQEYFAAVDVYECYLQEEDPTIISSFLQEHLHNSHWREVILLLLNKLNSKLVTNQLRKILHSEIKNSYSQYAELTEYNLFFVSQRLIEEINVEVDLAERVISRLGHLVRHTQVDLLRTNALDYLNKIMQTRQYAALGGKELLRLLKEEVPVRRNVASILLRNSIDGSEERVTAIEVLLELMRSSSYMTAIPAAKVLYEASSASSEERKQASQFMLQLIQRSDISVYQGIQAAKALCEVSPVGTEERGQAEQFLLQLIRHTDLSAEESVWAAKALCEVSPADSEEMGQAKQFLLQLIYCANASFDQIIQVALILRQYLPKDEEREQFTETLLELTQRSGLQFEQIIQIVQSIRYNVPPSHKEQEHATRVLMKLMQRSDLSVEQVIEVAEAMINVSSHEMRSLALQILLKLVQRPDLSIEQIITLNRVLSGNSSQDIKEQYLSTIKSIGQDESLDNDLRLKALAAVLMEKTTQYEEKVWAMRMLLDLNQKEVVQHYLNEKWDVLAYTSKKTDIPFLAELAEQEILPLWVRNWMYEQLRRLLSHV